MGKKYKSINGQFTPNKHKSGLLKSKIYFNINKMGKIINLMYICEENMMVQSPWIENIHLAYLAKRIYEILCYRLHC